VFVMVPALVLAVGAVVLVSKPRHRSSIGDGASTPAPPSLARAPGGPAVSPVAAVGPGHRGPVAGADGGVQIPVADRIPLRLPAEGLPAGWGLKEFTGRAAIELVRDDAGLAMRLRSAHTSFVVYRDAMVDLREFQILSWRWRVVKLPRAGDVRAAATDDQAAQVYVTFPRWPSPLVNSEVIGYVWDSRAPVGTRLTSTKAPNVRIIVVASGTAQLGVWQRQERNVAEDYVALFGRQPPRVGQVGLMIDSNDTRTEAEAFFGGLTFTKARSERMEKPTSMLR